MKYCLSSRQTGEYLALADEIKVQWRDRDIIFDLVEKYPNATINLRRSFADLNTPIDWAQINQFKVLSKGNFVFGLLSVEEMNTARDREIDFYYLSAIRTFQDLRDIMAIGVCRVRLGAPLFFQLEKVKRVCNLPLFTIANMASNDTIFERQNGVLGIWIRPEDLTAYSPYIDVVEFVGNQEQEQACYRIYNRGNWSGELNMVVQDLNYPCTNRMIPPELAEARMNCGQRCMENGNCHLCYRMFDLANPEKLRNYLETTKEN